MTTTSSNGDALKTKEDRLRSAEGRLKTLKQTQPDSPEIARFELIVADLKKNS